MHRGISRPSRLAAAAALAVIIAGCAGISPGPPPPDPTPTSATPTTDPTHQASAHRSPFGRLRGYLRHREGVVTAALYDRRTGKTWIYNPAVRQDTASIVKVLILATALREAAVAGRVLTPQEQALIRIMIENSDNDAATAMLAKVGGPDALRRFDRLAGLTDTTPSTLTYIPGSSLPGWGLTKTTALDQVRLVKKFAYPNKVLAAAGRRYGLRLMESVESDQAWSVSGGSSASLPSGTTVALKNGWLPHNLAAGSDFQINSIGWVSGHGRDYVLAVLSSGSPDQQYGEDTVSAIGRKVFAAMRP